MRAYSRSTGSGNAMSSWRSIFDSRWGKNWRRSCRPEFGRILSATTAGSNPIWPTRLDKTKNLYAQPQDRGVEWGWYRYIRLRSNSAIDHIAVASRPGELDCSNLPPSSPRIVVALKVRANEFKDCRPSVHTHCARSIRLGLVDILVGQFRIE